MQLNEKYLGKAIELEGIIDYQKDTIISSDLIKHTTGSVTAFAIDEGQSIEKHIVPFDAIIEVVEGEGIISIEDDEHVVKKGEMIILPADKYHSVKADQAFKMLLIKIKSE